MSSLKNAYDRVSLSERGFILRNLTTNGLIAGTQEAAVDGSVTPVKYYIQPLAGEVYILNTVSIVVSDGTSSVGLTDYGSIPGPLTNGIRFFSEKDGIETLLGLTFKSNQQLVDLGPVRDRIRYNSIILSAYDFNINQYADRGFLLNGNKNDKYGVIIQDDLSGLTSQTFAVKGSLRVRNI